VSLSNGTSKEKNPAVERVVIRRVEMQADARLGLPDTVSGDCVRAQPILPVKDQEYLAGISGGSGLAQVYALLGSICCNSLFCLCPLSSGRILFFAAACPGAGDYSKPGKPERLWCSWHLGLLRGKLSYGR
jgi:hypothetical protein